MQYFVEHALLGISGGGAYTMIALSMVAVHRGLGVVDLTAVAPVDSMPPSFAARVPQQIKEATSQ